MSLPLDSRLGTYVIVAPIGAGGMGEVYRARDTRLNRDVAIKVLPASVAGDPDRLARFEREAQAVAALSHANILAVYEFGAHEGQPFVVMELLQGQTLRERLAQGALPARKAIEVAIAIANGLMAAHGKQLIHRDLKPENVFLTNDGQIKILDFGLARSTVAPAGSGATQTIAQTDPGTVMGTVGYMAPEQVRGLVLDGRADLFSLGALLYEMLTGTRAFQRETAAETMTAILREDPPDLAMAKADLMPALGRIVHHALEKDPQERFQSARDVVFVLTALSGSTSALSGALAAAEPSAEARRTRVMAFAVSALLAVAAAIGGWWIAGRDQPSQVVRLSVTPPDRHLRFGGSGFGGNVEPHFAMAPDGQSIVYAAHWWRSGSIPIATRSREPPRWWWMTWRWLKCLGRPPTTPRGAATSRTPRGHTSLSHGCSGWRVMAACWRKWTSPVGTSPSAWPRTAAAWRWRSRTVRWKTKNRPACCRSMTSGGGRAAG